MCLLRRPTVLLFSATVLPTVLLFHGRFANFLALLGDTLGFTDHRVPKMAAAMTPAMISCVRHGSLGLRVLIILRRSIVRYGQLASRKREHKSERD